MFAALCSLSAAFLPSIDSFLRSHSQSLKLRFRNTCLSLIPYFFRKGINISKLKGKTNCDIFINSV